MDVLRSFRGCIVVGSVGDTGVVVDNMTVEFVCDNILFDVIVDDSDVNLDVSSDVC